MAAGGNRKSSSKKQQENYKTYQLINKVQTNKIRKLERHCKAYPKDKACAARLAELKKKGGYIPRAKPLAPRTEPTVARIRAREGFLHHPETAGEQLSRLLGIPLPKSRTRNKKPAISHKKRRNVKA